jgi:uncharacterized protein YecT (DUF1311 family)
MSKLYASRGFKWLALIIPLRVSAGLLLALTLSTASSFHSDAQTGSTAPGTRDDTTGTVTTPASGTKERRFAPGTIAKTIMEEASRLASDSIAWAQKLHELAVDVRNNAPDVDTTVRRVDECLVVLRAVARAWQLYRPKPVPNPSRRRAPAQAGNSQEQALVPRGTEKPSFACISARTAAARLICADRDLARLDSVLSVAFQSRRAQIAAPDQSRFVAKQLAWLRDRNTRCELVDGKSKAAIEELAPSKPCMMNAITERTTFLAQTTDPSIASSGRAQQPLSLLPPGIASPSESDAMPPIDIAALRKKLISLWSLPTSVASDPYHYVFKIRIRIGRDGRLIGPPIVLTNPKGPLFDAVRDSATRNRPGPAIRGGNVAGLRPESASCVSNLISTSFQSSYLDGANIS